MLCWLLAALPACGADELTIATWGGAYEASQRAAYFSPFQDDTGTMIDTATYRGGIDDIRDQVERGAVEWDLVDLVMADHDAACEAGLLETIDHDRLAPGTDGVPPTEDFLPGTLVRCGVAHSVYATVLGFNVRAYPGRKPSRAADLFDLQRFPGRRALQKSPAVVLEWALRSYGVPRADIYQLLSTERGLTLAFRRLERIRDVITWWEDPEEPARLLASGEVALASGYNGRFFDAAVNRGLPIQTIWESQVYEYSVWGIPQGSPHVEHAREFIRFATAPRQLAALSSRISYGPSRLSANALLWQHAGSGQDIRPHLPTYAPNFARGIPRDHEWYAQTRPRLEARFEAWLAE